MTGRARVRSGCAVLRQLRLAAKGPDEGVRRCCGAQAQGNDRNLGQPPSAAQRPYFFSPSSLNVPIALARIFPASSRASDSQNAVD